jgi:hypothetical protein
MRSEAMSGTSAPTTGTTGASTAGSNYGGGMRSGTTADRGPSTDDTVMDHPREAMGQVADQAQQKLMQVAGTAQEQAKSQLGGQLDQVGEALGSVADAMSSVGKQLREKDQDHLATLADQAAQRVDRFSGYVKGHDVDQLIGDVEDFARRQPMVFVGGAFVLGLMAARFLKSSRLEPAMPYRPYRGPGMSSGMRSSYGARPYSNGGYMDARRGPSYSGGMASSGSMRRSTDYSNGGYANGGPGGMNASHLANNRPSAATGTMPAGTGRTPDTTRTSTSAPMPSTSPAHETGSGMPAGSQRPASSDTGTSAGWGSTSGASTPTPPSTSSMGTTTPASSTPSRPSTQPHGSESTDRPEEGR